jgi:hypothetical protein
VRCGHQIGRARSGPGSSCSPGLQPGEDALRCSALTGARPQAGQAFHPNEVERGHDVGAHPGIDEKPA